ncbi:MAG: MSHA biogenesis protein MshK [Burkholderiales bacterium]
MTSICALVLVCAMSLPPALAGTLRDPTQPPAASGAGLEPERAPVAPARVLRSIRISAVDKVATIGGVNVRVGDAVGQATVVEIRMNEVVLREGTGTRTLKLYPGVHKQARGPLPQAVPVAVTSGTAQRIP